VLVEVLVVITLELLTVVWVVVAPQLMTKLEHQEP
jgi:hypothetical protein